MAQAGVWLVVESKERRSIMEKEEWVLNGEELIKLMPDKIRSTKTQST